MSALPPPQKRTFEPRMRVLGRAIFHDDEMRAGAVGLMAYGPNLGELYRRCGGYVAKILHGAKPSDLPIQRPEKFDLVINLKTVAALGLDMPSQLQQLADEVIE